MKQLPLSDAPRCWRCDTPMWPDNGGEPLGLGGWAPGWFCECGARRDEDRKPVSESEHLFTLEDDL